MKTRFLAAMAICLIFGSFGCLNDSKNGAISGSTSDTGIASSDVTSTYECEIDEDCPASGPLGCGLTTDNWYYEQWTCEQGYCAQYISEEECDFGCGHFLGCLPEEVACEADSDCADDDPCTTDVCHNQPSGIYCMNVQKSDGADCHVGIHAGNQGYDMGVCNQGVCDTFTCGSSDECDDGDPCTQDYLDKGGCKNTPIPECKVCETDAECSSPDLCSESGAPVCKDGLRTFRSHTLGTAIQCVEGRGIQGGFQTGGTPITPSGTTCGYNTYKVKIHAYTYDASPDTCWCIGHDGYAYRPTIAYIPYPKERWVLKCCSDPP